MAGKIKEKFVKTSLTSKIRLSFVLLCLPIVALFLVSYMIFIYENKKYDDMIDAAVKASEFSLDFKDDFDYETYLVIVESKNFDESLLRPMLADATKVVDNLERDIDMSGENAQRLLDVKKYLNNLDTYVGRIENNLNTGDMYEENIEIWENDVQIVTGLIKETILQFMYYEIKDIQSMREEVERLYEKVITITIIIMVLMVVIMTGASYFVANTITKPIRKLCDVTDKISGGDLSIRANIEGGTEVSVLSESFDKMIDRINVLLDEVKEEQIHLRKAELEILQSQINPHFLYNTLDTIVWLAEAGDQKKVVSMVGSLSDFFRSTLNDGRDIVQVRDELKHVSSYLEIQQVRYQDILGYTIDVPEEIYDYYIPKISIQPLVENALYHGIKNKRGRGNIKVSGELSHNYVIIYVEDDGIGIRPERLTKIKELILSQDNEGDVFGLHNVDERIKLKYGEEYGIDIESTYGKGTKVSIMLPATVTPM